MVVVPLCPTRREMFDGRGQLAVYQFMDQIEAYKARMGWTMRGASAEAA